MKKAIIIVGGLTVIGVAAYLFFKPKKALKDSLNESDKNTTTSGGTTSGGTTSGGTTSGGTTISDANINLANATILASERKTLVQQTKRRPLSVLVGGTFANTNAITMANETARINLVKKKIAEIDKKLAALGYKVDATGQLLKI